MTYLGEFSAAVFIHFRLPLGKSLTPYYWELQNSNLDDFQLRWLISHTFYDRKHWLFIINLWMHTKFTIFNTNFGFYKGMTKT